MRKVYERRLTLLLGRQKAREPYGKRGKLWRELPGAETFRDLFPDLVGQELVVDNRGVSVSEPRRMLAVMWLSQNGYL